MADKYLALKTMAPGQFVQQAELATRLPPPAPPGQADAADDVTAEDAPAPVPAAPAADTPSPNAPAAVALAELAHPAAPLAAASGHAAAKQVARAAPKKAAHPAALADGEAPFHGTPMQRGTPLPLAGLPARARVLSAMARPTQMNRARSTVVTATPSAIGSAAYVGSALSGGSSLPPPVPLQ